jgi:hypothetical protein
MRIDRPIRLLCREALRGGKTKEALKGKGIYNGIVKLVYDKINDYIPLPKINCTKSELSEVLQLAAYPILREAHIRTGKTPQHIPPLFSPLLRNSNNIKDLTKKIYGKKYDYGVKQLGGLLTQKEDSWLSAITAYLLRGIVPIEYTKEILENNYTIFQDSLLFGYKPVYKLTRQFLKQFHPKTILRLLTTGSAHELYDTINMWKDYHATVPLPRHIGTLTELHDYYSKETLKLQHKNFELKTCKQALPLDNIHLDGMVIRIPKTNHELLEWGRQMHNCIGSYGRRVGEDNRILLGITRDGKLIYNIEITGKRIRQFYAKHNSPPNQEDYDLIKKYLTERKICV